MGNEIGKFSLEHVSNVYIQDANGQISNQTNWKGTSDVAGIAYGTLIFGPNDVMEMNDNLSIGRGIAAIGNIYHSKGAHENALKNYRRSLKMFNKIGYKRGVANLLANIGLIFNIKGDKEAALKNFNSSLEIREEIHEKENMGQTINNIGGIYFLDCITTENGDT